MHSNKKKENILGKEEKQKIWNPKLWKRMSEAVKKRNTGSVRNGKIAIRTSGHPPRGRGTLA